MPIYDYECSYCGLVVTQHVLDYRDADRLAPMCYCKAADSRPRRTHRIYSAPNVHFKGEGWTPRYHR